MKLSITPFNIASLLLLLFALYIGYLHLIVQRPDPHTFGLLFAILGLLLAIVLFGIDRILVRRVTYTRRWIIESIALLIIAIFFVM